MEIEFITTISLIWLIYTFVFGDIDKLVSDTVNRLRFALSVNVTGEKVGALNLVLLQAHGAMGIPELISYGKEMEKTDRRASRLIKTFSDEYLATETFKSILFWNLFALTTHAVCYSIFCLSSLSFVEFHIVLSLLLVAIFYWLSRKALSSLVFSEIKFPETARDASAEQVRK